jgi:hypothetical protein
MSTSHAEIWVYRHEGRNGSSLEGYTVQATDGKVGKIESAIESPGSNCIVVGTGSWIRGKKMLLPAGVIEVIDDDSEEVWVNLTREQIDSAPDIDESAFAAEQGRTALDEYYGRFFIDTP